MMGVVAKKPSAESHQGESSQLSEDERSVLAKLLLRLASEEVERRFVDSAVLAVHLMMFLQKEGFADMTPPWTSTEKSSLIKVLQEKPSRDLIHSSGQPKVERLTPIINRVTDIIGDRQEAMRWLGTPVRGLDFATPISLLGTEEGEMRVNDILGQMEHGIW
jgi:hypothetical protein